MKNKGFRRIAFGLITVSLITAVVAAAYLYFNFNSKSNLILVVPQDSDWVYQFRTRQIKGKLKATPPPFFDSLRICIQKMPAFSGLKDAGEVGVALYSDIIVFANTQGWYLALSVNSETRLTQFIKEKMPKNLAGGVIPHPDCKYVKAAGKNLYFAWKHKACVFFIPKDTLENLDNTNHALSIVFGKNNTKPITLNPLYQSISSHNDDVLFFGKSGLISEVSHGVTINESDNVAFYYPDEAKKTNQISPLYIFQKAGIKIEEKDIAMYLSKDNSISTYNYLNLTFKAMFQYLKPLSND